MMIDFGSFRFKRALRKSLGSDLALDRVEVLSDRLACGFGMCLLGSTRPGLDPLDTGTGYASSRSRCHPCNVRIEPPPSCTAGAVCDLQTDQTQVSPAPNRPQRAVRSGAECVGPVESSRSTAGYLGG